MKNILFATVRQGNCGDEFILFGTQNILSSLQSEYNPVILNKNVEVCRRLQFRNKNLTIQLPGMNKNISLNLEDICFRDKPLEDNSFADYFSLTSIDAVVFSGTPEWVVYKLLPLYEKLREYDGPVFFLGPGFHEGFASKTYPDIHPIYREIHKRADVFVVRDRLLLEYLSPEIHAELLPCPALLCSKTQKRRERLKKIGLTLQAKAGEARVNYVAEDIYDFSLKLLETLSRYFEVEVVCHWIEDLVGLGRKLGDAYPVRYSYDARDYLDMYDSYDLVVSTRVHGSGMAASLGIPTFTISHSMRTDTVNGFLSRIIQPNDSVEDILVQIRGLDLPAESERIIKHKESTLEAYRKILAPYFPL